MAIALDWTAGFGCDQEEAGSISPCMSQRASLAQALEQIAQGLQSLSLGLREREIGQEDAGNFELVSSPEPATSGAAGSTSEPAVDRPLVARSVEWEAALQAATTAGELLALDLSPIHHLLRTCRLSSVKGWTPEARLGLAYRSGRAVRFELDGESERTGPHINTRLPIKVFVVIKSGAFPEGFWTTDFNQFYSGIGDPHRIGVRHPGTIYRSFASQAEGSAFLLGAECQWPRRLP